MSEEWKKFLLQWILPVGVFFIAMIFAFASFNASITSSASSEYEKSLVSTTESYARTLSDAVDKTKSIATVASESLINSTLDRKAVVGSLSSIVSNSDAYMAIYCDSSGRGVTNEDADVELNAMSYYGDLENVESLGYIYVPSDEVENVPAIVLKIDVAGVSGCIYAYTASDMVALKNIIDVDKKVDTTAYAIVSNADGEIIMSTNKNLQDATGKNVWDMLIDGGNAESVVRRMRTKAQSGNSGSFDANISGGDMFVCYAPIPGDNRELMIAYGKKNYDRAITKIVAKSKKSLAVLGVLIGIFVAAVTLLNILQISTNTKSKEDLQDKADRDQLTGLKNKISTEREIKEYIEMYPDSIGMLFLIDIDNFKKINDTMGHAFGDEVLREIGRHIGINFRVSDVIGRIGGDEFMVFLKNLKEDANTIKEAQKLIYFFRHFQVGDYVKYSVTASIGAAVFPAHGADFESLYKSADAAVYKSKKRGKNQLSFFDDRDRTPEEIAEADSHLIDIARKPDTPIDN